MKEIAYTLGARKSYDQALREGVCTKWGTRPDEDPPYEGGWVWKTAADAEAFSASVDFDAKVYGLHLPSGWDADVSPEPHPSDGVHRLLHDAVVFEI